MIPGYTDSYKNIKAIARVMKDLGLKKIDILPYHRFSEGKYNRLAKEYTLKRINPSTIKKRIEYVHKFFEGQGFSVKKGG